MKKFAFSVTKDTFGNANVIGSFNILKIAPLAFTIRTLFAYHNKLECLLLPITSALV
jgi:hypothetical protein